MDRREDSGAAKIRNWRQERKVQGRRYLQQYGLR